MLMTIFTKNVVSKDIKFANIKFANWFGHSKMRRKWSKLDLQSQLDKANSWLKKKDGDLALLKIMGLWRLSNLWCFAMIPCRNFLWRVLLHEMGQVGPRSIHARLGERQNSRASCSVGWGERLLSWTQGRWMRQSRVSKTAEDKKIIFVVQESQGATLDLTKELLDANEELIWDVSV